MTPLELHMIRRWLRGMNVAPCRTAPDGNPYGRALPVTTRYGLPGSWQAGHHTGEDYAAPTGSLAVASRWGRVVEVGNTSWGSAYGTAVVVRTASGVYDYGLCHLSAVHVKVGQRVRPGTVVGLTGSTGRVTGPHLHFEARTAGGRYGDDVHPRLVRGRG